MSDNNPERTIVEAASRSELVADLADEFAERLRRGERPLISEYVNRCPEAADEICEVLSALVHVEWLAPGPHEEFDSAGAETTDLPPFCQLGDFRIIREVGRGGMGIVYEAEQVSLGRRVALKVLPQQLLASDHQRQRFQREAKAAAQLHHTNIVPVFGVGEQDGLHYYVMQFIQGLGLDEVIVELKRLRQERDPGYQATEQAGPVAAEVGGEGELAGGVSAADVAHVVLTGHIDRTMHPRDVFNDRSDAEPCTLNSQQMACDPPSDTVVGRLSETVTGTGQFSLPGQTPESHSSSSHAYWESVSRIGLQAAQALQYAHDQGIIHRDVKPANLLLDSFGSVWVTDFGLAKAADQQDLTHTGDVLGTLRYMAPEQLEGKTDARSDVYSLGLTLYELLVLKPAFDERDRHQAIRQVTAGTPLRLRTLNRTIPRDLETIVHKAMDRERAHRYQTAGELADDLSRFLRDEPIRARRPPVLQRIGKWTRRHRAVVTTAGLCVTVGMVLVAGTIGWAARDRTAALAARQARLATQVEMILDDVSRLEDDGKWDEALAAARRADAALASGEGTPTVREHVQQVLHELEMVHLLEKIRHERAVWREDGFDNTGAAASYARAFLEFGCHLEDCVPDEAVSHLEEYPNIRLALAAALDDFADARLQAYGPSDDIRTNLMQVAGGLDPDPLRNRLRALLGRPNDPELRAELLALAERMTVAEQAPATLVLLARSLVGIGRPDSGRTLLRQAQIHHPDDFWINFHLAELARQNKDNDAAIRFFTAALASHPSAHAARNNLALLLVQQNRLDEAEVHYRRAIKRDPDFGRAHSNLGRLLIQQNRFDEAEAAFRRAIELGADEPKSYNDLAIVYVRQGRHDDAEASYRGAIQLDPDLAEAHYNLGNLLRKQSKLNEAVASYRRAIERNPGYTSAHFNLGNVLAAQDRFAEAEDSYRRAIEIDPSFVQAHSNLGSLLLARNRLDDAEACYRRAVEVNDDYATGHYNLGVLLHEQGRFGEAEASYGRAIETAPEDARAHNNLGVLLNRRSRFDEAEASFRRAIDLDAAFPSPHVNLRDLMWKTERFGDALAAGGRVAELRPNDANAHHTLAWFLVTCPDGRLHDAARSIKLAERAIEIDPDRSAFHGTLGIAHYRAGHWSMAIDVLTGAIRPSRDNSADLFFLAMAHWQIGQTEEARTWFQEAANRMEENGPVDEELFRFRAEAEELILSATTSKNGAVIP